MDSAAVAHDEDVNDMTRTVRCFGTGDPLYEDYHDHEWGVPVRGERDLFERVVLEGFQCGLSWSTVLRRRDALREAYAGFEPEILVSWGERDVERLLTDSRVLKNRRKIESVITNARTLVALHEAGDTLERLVWSFVPASHERPASPAEMPSRSPEGDALAKALKQAGFRFVGPTTAHATLQAIGVVNDHAVGCLAGDAIEARAGRACSGG